jgi:hypothetical protein
MRSHWKFAGYAAALALGWGAQSGVSRPVLAASTPTPAATGRSMTVPLEERNGSRVHGTVTLTAQGPKTIVHVYATNFAALRSSLSLAVGTNCQDAPGGAVAPIPLNPISAGQVSHTIVAIPIESFKNKNFAVSVRDATTRQQLLAACARIGH